MTTGSLRPAIIGMWLLSCLVASIAVLDPLPSSAQGPPTCFTPAPLGAPFWKAGVEVTILFRQGDFSSVQRTAVQRAAINWNDSRGLDGNTSGVRFVGFTQTSSPLSSFLCVGPGCPDANHPVQYFYKGMVSEGVAEVEIHGDGIYATAAATKVKAEFNWTPSGDPFAAILTVAAAHEMGHTFNLAHCYNACNGLSVMGAAFSLGVRGPTTCDNCAVLNNYQGLPTTTSCATPTPTPTPTPPPGQNCTTAGWNGDCPPGTEPDGYGWCCAAEGCGGLAPEKEWATKETLPTIANPNCCSDYDRLMCYQGGGEWYESQCACYSPIVIDLAGNGFNLTGAEDGVMFDIPGDGVSEQISWTAANSDDAWLVIDRNGNGVVDNGKELFGSSTAQPSVSAGESKNGFRALAMFDTTSFGGNNDGQIDRRDSVFSRLQLWQDRNHNGFSEAEELQNLSASVICVIELSYKESRRRDDNGNWFRYRAKVRDIRGAQAGRWAWDVFLQKPH